MATIGAAVSTKTKIEFESAANARGTTTSRLAASLIENFLKGEVCADGPADRIILCSSAIAPSEHAEMKTEQVHVRLTPFYFAELGRLANERQWYRGTYLANLFRVHLEGQPVLCGVEINAVRQVARQLADMGRNINQVVKKLNTSLEHAHLATSIDFELIKMLIELETNTVKDLIKANVSGWGVGDVEA